MTTANKHIGHVFGNQFTRTLLVGRVLNRPHKRNRHTAHIGGLKHLDGGQNVVFIQGFALRAIGQHAAAHWAAQFAWRQLGSGWVRGIVAVAFFFVAQADFNAVFMACGTQQAHFHAFELNQGIQAHGGAVDAQITALHQFFYR